jgi:hypothetical protein
VRVIVSDPAHARAPAEAQAAREVTLYLGAWHAMNPDAWASIAA